MLTLVMASDTWHTWVAHAQIQSIHTRSVHALDGQQTNLALRFVEAVTQNVDFISQPGFILLCSCEIDAKGVSLAMLLV